MSETRRFECKVCGYIYDESEINPDNGAHPVPKWEELSEDWVCPVCGAGKEEFEQLTD